MYIIKLIYSEGEEEMSEVIGKIFVTKDYAKFKKLKGNRQIKKNQNLEESIKNSGIMIPIEVNEYFEILDGQNRFELAKKWNQLIPYRILDGSGIQEVIELNSTTKSWTLIDYINKYCLDGKKDYLLLKELKNKYIKIPISSLASAGEGYLNLNQHVTNSIREGNFSFYNYDIFCTFLEQYSLFLTETGIKSGQYTLFAFFNLYTTKGFDLERLITGVANEVESVNDNNNLYVIMEIFLKAYEYSRLKDKKSAIIYEINDKEQPDILTTRNTTLWNGKR